MSMSLQSRIGIITGASAGIGEACAREFVSLGARVVINARREGKLAELAGVLNEDKPEPRAVIVPGDCSDDAVIERLFAAAREGFGEDADLVLINAGRGLRGSVTDSNTDEWEEMLRTNYLGAAKLLRASAHHMKTLASPPASAESQTPRKTPPPPQDAVGEVGEPERSAGEPGGGRSWLERPRDIVVLGSTVGRHISPFSSMYGSTKFAVHSLAEALRRELAQEGIRVTNIEPGIVRSEFQESAGYDIPSFSEFMESISPVLRPDDVADLIAFICSRRAHVSVNDAMIRPTRQQYP